MSYHVLWQMKQGIIQDSESEITCDRMVKKIKAHQCAMDFDHSFCKAIYKEDLPGDKYL